MLPEQYLNFFKDEDSYNHDAPHRLTLTFNQTTLGLQNGATACVFISVKFILLKLDYTQVVLQQGMIPVGSQQLFLQTMVSLVKNVCLEAIQENVTYSNNKQINPWTHKQPCDVWHHCYQQVQQQFPSVIFYSAGSYTKENFCNNFLFDVCMSRQITVQKIIGILLGYQGHMLSILRISDTQWLLFNSLPVTVSRNFLNRALGHLFGNAYLILFDSINAPQQIAKYIREELLGTDTVNTVDMYFITDGS